LIYVLSRQDVLDLWGLDRRSKPCLLPAAFVGDFLLLVDSSRWRLRAEQPLGLELVEDVAKAPLWPFFLFDGEAMRVMSSVNLVP
jgi:hypothetical protein